MFTDKTILIAGPATPLAVAIARAFARHNGRVALAVAGEAGATGTDALQGIDFPVSMYALEGGPAGAGRLADNLAADFGRLDVWVNLPGAVRPGAADELSADEWQAGQAALAGVFFAAQAAGRQMLARAGSPPNTGGTIVNLAAVEGLRPVEGRLASHLLHAGIIALTRALAVEWAGRGVRVCGAACPESLLSGEPASNGPNGSSANGSGGYRRIPQRRLPALDEVAEAVAFLTSDEAAYVVGEVLPVDGGWNAYQLF